MKKWRQFICVLLTLCMLVTLVPTAALATDTGNQPAVTQEEQNESVTEEQKGDEDPDSDQAVQDDTAKKETVQKSDNAQEESAKKNDENAEKIPGGGILLI